MAYNAGQIKEILSNAGRRANRALGQNFCTDTELLSRCVKTAGFSENSRVLEIGPGLGALTREVLAAGASVTAVEKDGFLADLLPELLPDSRLNVYHEDILRFPISEHVDPPFSVAGNLPYYITTPIVERMLPLFPDVMLFMVQKEVADRILAAPGTENYGALTIAAGYYASLSNAGTVPPSCFYPRPGVDSALLLMRRYEERPVRSRDEQLMFRLVRASFNQRRKTLVNAVSHFEGLSFSREDVCRALVSCGLPEDVRGERLSAADFAHLTDALLSFA